MALNFEFHDLPLHSLPLFSFVFPCCRFFFSLFFFFLSSFFLSSLFPFFFSPFPPFFSFFFLLFFPYFVSPQFPLFFFVVAYSPCIIVIVVGLVEELVVDNDPEYQWMDNFRQARTSNESRQSLLFKLDATVRRQLGKKVRSAAIAAAAAPCVRGFPRSHST